MGLEANIDIANDGGLTSSQTIVAANGLVESFQEIATNEFSSDIAESPQTLVKCSWTGCADEPYKNKAGDLGVFNTGVVLCLRHRFEFFSKQHLHDAVFWQRPRAAGARFGTGYTYHVVHDIPLLNGDTQTLNYIGSTDGSTTKLYNRLIAHYEKWGPGSVMAVMKGGRDREEEQFITWAHLRRYDVKATDAHSLSTEWFIFCATQPKLRGVSAVLSAYYDEIGSPPRSPLRLTGPSVKP